MGEFAGYVPLEPVTQRPVYHVSAISHRNEAILPVVAAGEPVEENHTAWGIPSAAQILHDLRAAGLAVTIIRPGAIWGGEELWDAGLGHVLGPLWLAVGDGVTRKFTYVENCAEAIVLAAEREEAIGQTLNIVDDDVPTQREYARILKQHGIGVPTGLRIPFACLRALVHALDRVNAKAFAGRARVPDMLNPTSLDARFKRLVYPNTRAKAVLDWAPRYGLEEGLKRAIAQRA